MSCQHKDPFIQLECRPYTDTLVSEHNRPVCRIEIKRLLEEIDLFLAEGKDPIAAIKQHQNNENVLIHFSNIGGDNGGSRGFKLGINPGTDFNTPAGVYGYPLTRQIVASLESTRNVPFAGERKWCYIFKGKGKIIQVGYRGDAKNYSDSDLERDIEKLRKAHKYDFDDFDFEVEWAMDTTKTKTAFGKLWNITRIIAEEATSGKATVTWSKILRGLGIDGVIDAGSGLIHPNEPTQGVILSSNKIEILDVVENPVKHKVKAVKRGERSVAYKIAAEYLGDTSKVGVIEKLMGSRRDRAYRPPEKDIEQIKRALQDDEFRRLALSQDPDEVSWMKIEGMTTLALQSGEFEGMTFTNDTQLNAKASWFDNCEFQLGKMPSSLRLSGTLSLTNSTIRTTSDAVAYGLSDWRGSYTPEQAMEMAAKDPKSVLNALQIGIDKYIVNLDATLIIDGERIKVTG